MFRSPNRKETVYMVPILLFYVSAPHLWLWETFFLRRNMVKKEEFIRSFNELGFEDKIEVVKAIMPEFCKSLSPEPQRMREMMKSMMSFWNQDMAGMMGLMKK